MAKRSKSKRSRESQSTRAVQPGMYEVSKRDGVAFEVSTDGDLFVTVHGLRIAQRADPDSPLAKTWVPIEPGWQVFDDGPDAIVVMHQGVRVH